MGFCKGVSLMPLLWFCSGGLPSLVLRSRSFVVVLGTSGSPAQLWGCQAVLAKDGGPTRGQGLERRDHTFGQKGRRGDGFPPSRAVLTDLTTQSGKFPFLLAAAAVGAGFTSGKLRCALGTEIRTPPLGGRGA